MKGDTIIFALLAVAVLVAVVIIIELPMLGGVSQVNWEKTVKLMDLRPSSITTINFRSLESFQTGNLPNATRIISNDGEPYSVSEIACDIAKDVFNDFTTWGEFHRGPYLPAVDSPNFKPYMKLNDKFLCEYYNKSDGGGLGYFCLMSYGLFNFSSISRTLTQTNRDNLTQAKCCLAADNSCGCTVVGGSEYKLDEVCLNEMFSDLRYKGESLCTDGVTEYIRMGEPGTPTFQSERLKFGNNVCYCNSNNNPPPISEEGLGDWCMTPLGCCSGFCNSLGDSYDWPPGSPHAATEKDYDRIVWWADSNVDKYYVNDNFLITPDVTLGYTAPKYDSSSREVRDDGNLYFYQVIWWDLATNFGYSNLWKRYTVIFSKVPTQERTSLDKNNFINKFLVMFDNETKARMTIAGRWWPEMRTVYDGVINLTEDVSLKELQLKLENLNSYADVKRCSAKSDCLDYNINMEDWGEFIFDYDSASGKFFLPGRNRVYVRTNSEGEWIESGLYRVIARNWYSSYAYSQMFDAPAGSYWCKNDKILTVGRKIYYVPGNTCPAGTEESIDRGSSAGWGTAGATIWAHFVVQRYADKSLIIYKLGCTDSDKTINNPSGINYNLYGEVSSTSNVFEGDYCDTDDLTLHEKYCDELGQISERTYTCPGVCKDGACCLTNGAACTSTTDCCSGLKCASNVCTFTQCNDKIDNDNDGDMDLADPSCSNMDDDNECGVAGISCTADANCCSPLTCMLGNFCGPTQCSDSADNDSDGVSDLNDPDCSGGSDNTECSAIGFSCTINANCCSGLVCSSNICSSA